MATALATGLLALTLAPAAMAQPEPDEETGPVAEYGIRPGYYGDTELPGGHFNHSLEPGAAVRDAVEIFNFTEAPLTFDVYGADLVIAEGGGFAPALRDAEPVGGGGWITPDEATVEVAADDSLVVPLTVRAPEDALPGEHPAAVVVERHTAEAGPGITVQPRLALRMLLDVPGEIDLGVALGPLEAAREGGAVTFALPVRNTGNVTFTTSGLVDVDSRWRGPGELSLSPEGLYAVPDGAATLRTVWEDPPWIGRAHAHAVIDVQVGDHDPVPYSTEPITVWLVPWTTLLVALAALAVGGVLAYATRHRRRRRRQRRREERQLLRDFRASRDAQRTTAEGARLTKT